MKIILWATSLGLGLLLAGCGGGGSTTSGLPSGGTGSSGGGGSGSGTIAPAPSMTLAMTDPSNNPTSSVSAGAPVTVTATVKDEAGTLVPGALVTFTTDEVYGRLDPASGTALTDSNGVARVQLSPGSQSGAATLRVKAVYRKANRDVTVENAINYQSSPGSVPTVSISSLTFGLNPLSAYGTTSVRVVVSGTSAPLVVSFTSLCAAQGKASLTPQVTTVNGEAIASYRDNGCAGTDTVTASVLTGVAATANLTVQSPTVSSIQFVSATPQNIALRGTGGAGRTETAVVKFKVLDQAGNPIARTVDFTLSTTVGGLSLSAVSANSDATTGEVQTNVQAGTVATPVRVTATVRNTTISTQSDQLSVSSGIPDQAHFSVSVSTFNIDGWDYDGVTTEITARLADHFGNPVPDGTTVSFIAEGGRIGSGTQGSCNTVNSACSVTFTSQELRPTDGRVTILAYAIGNESFNDLNGNGVVDSTSERVDVNGISTDLPEAWVDYNEDGSRDTNEPFVDFNQNGNYDEPDSLYTGILCNTAVANLCSASSTLNVFRNVVVVLSGKTAVIDFVDGSGNPITSFNLGGCTNAGRSYNLFVRVRDQRGNPMPAGTQIIVTTTNGTIPFGSSHTVPNTTGGVGSNPFGANPTSVAFTYPIELKNDASLGTTCVDNTPSGNLRVSVRTPRGDQTDAVLAVSN